MNPSRLLATLGCALLGAQAGAAVLIDESFDYGLANETALLGLPGVSGSNWAVSSGTTANFTFLASGLTHPLLDLASGGAALVSNNAAVPQQAFALDNTGTTYFAFLLKDMSAQAYTGARVLFEAYGSSTEGYGINFNHAIDGVTGAQSLAIWARAGSAQGVSVTNIPLDQTLLIVGRFDPTASAFGTTTIWVNPTDVSSIDALTASALGVDTATASVAVVRDDGIVFRSQSGIVGPWFAVDEMRLGNSLGDLGLVAIPEPGATTMLGLGMLAFLALRRR